MNFTSIDVETANADLSSICQIGIVKFADGKVVDKWSSLVNPEDEFDSINISIHGIDEKKVKNAPTLPRIEKYIHQMLSDTIVACHTPFDRVAINQAYQRYNLEPLGCTWLDTARVSRRAWTQFAYQGYGLANIAHELGIEFKHHDALEDARAAGEILVRAVTDCGISVEEWLARVRQPIFGTKNYRITREGLLDGPLAGEVVVFTGALSIPRREAADMAASIGCDVSDNVTPKTTLLVVGDQDIRKLAGHEKSSKHRKAEQLIAQGQPIRILGEKDFQRIFKENAAQVV
ncbi:MAG: exonuclease domain-containing protein [Chloroflexota bacterium]